MNVLELGNYIAPAYAGMVLAEQGHAVTKVHNGKDPIPKLHMGDELWAWINHGKVLRPFEITDTSVDDLFSRWVRDADVVIDNFREEFWESVGVYDRDALAKAYEVRWVSLQVEIGDTGFDVIAQARSWMEYSPWVPFYVGDTTAGLWMAFKAMQSQLNWGWYPIYHASVMQKMVEGELVIDRPEGPVPWDVDNYRGTHAGAEVDYKGRHYREPVRDREWKLANMKHIGGRILV